MRERNLYLEKCRQIEQMGEDLDWRDPSSNGAEQSLLDEVHRILYSNNSNEWPYITKQKNYMQDVSNLVLVLITVRWVFPFSLFDYAFPKLLLGLLMAVLLHVPPLFGTFSLLLCGFDVRELLLVELVHNMFMLPARFLELNVSKVVYGWRVQIRAQPEINVYQGHECHIERCIMLDGDTSLQHHQQDEGEDHSYCQDQAELVGLLHLLQSALEQARVCNQCEVASVKDKEDHGQSLKEWVEWCTG